MITYERTEGGINLTASIKHRTIKIGERWYLEVKYTDDPREIPARYPITLSMLLNAYLGRQTTK